jgi:N-acetyl-anhydromuramyl-L-alanine amidase AmpD
MIKIFLFFYFSIFLAFSIQSQTSTLVEIISMPISYNQERVRLSLEYLRDRHGLIQTTPMIIPKIIVLHYTAGGTLNGNFSYFNKTTIEDERRYNKNQSLLNVSAHYLVDRDGKIYQLLPDTLFARHTIGLNYCAIGVENVGSNTEPLTDAQITSNAKLVRHLKGLYNIEYLIGHSEYGQFRNTNIWKETNPSYFTGKDDPGKMFMQRVRELVKDLKIKSQP